LGQLRAAHSRREYIQWIAFLRLEMKEQEKAVRKQSRGAGRRS
jgi:hypothetical protein